MHPAPVPAATPLDRVIVVALKKVANQRGHLMEVQRRDDAHFPGFGQVYVTCTRPGIVKAWYRHRQQVDQIALVSGALQLALFDDRDDSPTRGAVQEIIITEAQPVLVQIPTGIWHGFRALGADDAYLLHLNTHLFDADHLDEDRRPADDAGIPFRWSV
jgi:dTDP-4-dehydrorhamnose 3,5-epimerase